LLFAGICYAGDAAVALDASTEETMAKGQMKSNKETKKPKAEKPKATVSAYKASQGKSGQSTVPVGKKS
jgi:hypothetical protein